MLGNCRLRDLQYGSDLCFCQPGCVVQEQDICLPRSKRAGDDPAQGIHNLEDGVLPCLPIDAVGIVIVPGVGVLGERIQRGGCDKLDAGLSVMSVRGNGAVLQLLLMPSLGRGTDCLRSVTVGSALPPGCRWRLAACFSRKRGAHCNAPPHGHWRPTGRYREYAPKDALSAGPSGSESASFVRGSLSKVAMKWPIECQLLSRPVPPASISRAR